MSDSQCTLAMAQAHAIQLRDDALRARPGHELRDALALAATVPSAVLIRFAGAEDLRTLDRLAQLDSARPLTLPILVAELEGELWAALSLFDDRLVADPFHPTQALTELLRTRARQLSEAREGGLLVALRHPLRTLRAIRLAVAAAA